MCLNNRHYGHLISPDALQASRGLVSRRWGGWAGIYIRFHCSKDDSETIHKWVNFLTLSSNSSNAISRSIEKYTYPINLIIFFRFMCLYCSHTNLTNAGLMYPSDKMYGICGRKIRRTNGTGSKFYSHTKRTTRKRLVFGVMAAPYPCSPILCRRPVEAAWSVSAEGCAKKCTKLKPIGISCTDRLRPCNGTPTRFHIEDLF